MVVLPDLYLQWLKWKEMVEDSDNKFTTSTFKKVY